MTRDDDDNEWRLGCVCAKNLNIKILKMVHKYFVFYRGVSQAFYDDSESVTGATIFDDMVIMMVTRSVGAPTMAAI